MVTKKQIELVTIGFGIDDYHRVLDAAIKSHEPFFTFIKNAVWNRINSMEPTGLSYVGDGRIDDYEDYNGTEIGRIIDLLTYLVQTWNNHRIRVNVPAVAFVAEEIAKLCDARVDVMISCLLDEEPMLTDLQYERNLHNVYCAVIDYVERKTAEVLA